MFSNILGFGDQLFTSIILLLAAGVSSHIMFGIGSKKGRETFVGLIILLLIGLQMYHLMEAAIYIPANKFFVYNSSYVRFDCLNSDKGGKRPRHSKFSYDLNPCFCQSAVAKCFNKLNGSEIYGLCPTDGTAVCRNTFDNSRIYRHVSAFRNCRGGQKTSCTKDEPCDPCEINKIIEFGSERCRTCSTDFRGDCHFVPDVGPYCYESKGSKTVVPCKVCCTEPTPVFVNNTCY